MTELFINHHWAVNCVLIVLNCWSNQLKKPLFHSNRHTFLVLVMSKYQSYQFWKFNLIVYYKLFFVWLCDFFKSAFDPYFVWSQSNDSMTMHEFILFTVIYAKSFYAQEAKYSCVSKITTKFIHRSLSRIKDIVSQFINLFFNFIMYNFEFLNLSLLWKVV